MPESSGLISVSHGLDVVTLTTGAALIWTGVQFYLEPQPFAKFYGLAKASADELIVLQSATGRNIGAGLFVCIMTFLGEKKALGIFLLCWTMAGIADSKVLNEHPHGNRIGVHVRNIIILLILGPLLIGTSMI